MRYPFRQPNLCRTASAAALGSILIFGLSGTALAETESERTEDFFGNDERQIVKPIDAPWSAVGKVVFSNGDFCTGTLIAENIALTAAHCIFDGDESDPDAQYDRQSPIYFLAGYHDGRFAAAAHIAETWVPPDFDMNRFLQTFDVDDRDFALLRLEEPIGQSTGWFQIAPLEAQNQQNLLGPDGPKVNQAGYSGDSPDFLTAHIGCRLTQFEPNSTVWHQCDTMNGDSGSPLFYQRDGMYWLIALESQSIQTGDDWINSAIDVRAFADAIKTVQQDWQAPPG